MVRQLIIGVVLTVALSLAAGNAYADGAPGDPAGGLILGTDKPVGTFCKVEKADVCVLTMSEEDCTKLGGEKVDSCSMPEKAEDK